MMPSLMYSLLLIIWKNDGGDVHEENIYLFDPVGLAPVILMNPDRTTTPQKQSPHSSTFLKFLSMMKLIIGSESNGLSLYELPLQGYGETHDIIGVINVFSSVSSMWHLAPLGDISSATPLILCHPFISMGSNLR